jgi:hypothetical protein
VNQASALWSSGDYSQIAARFEPIADDLVATLGEGLTGVSIQLGLPDGAGRAGLLPHRLPAARRRARGGITRRAERPP